MRDYRSEFPDFSPTIYLDCAYQGPFPLATVPRIQRAIELKCHPERLEAPEYFRLPERVRVAIARVVGADPCEIALTTSVTQGMGIIASGFPLQAGEEVVVSSANFPSNLFTWLHLRRLGVQVRLLRPAELGLKIEQVAAALTPRTRIVALDWVDYCDGTRIDLEALGELVHRYGAILVVDGTQGAGALELDLHALPVDVMAVAGYKWLLGPYGTGFVYLRPEVQDRLDLQVVNWCAVEGSEDFDSLPREQFKLPKAARVFDAGETANFLNLYALEASLEFIQRVGVTTITRHCRHLLDRLSDGLRRQGFCLSAAAELEHHSTILGFRAGTPQATQTAYERLKANHIAVSLRHGAIRVSPHLYNTEADIDQLLEIVGTGG